MPRTKQSNNPYGTVIEREAVKSGKLRKCFDARKRYTKPNGAKSEKSKRCWSRSEANAALLNFAAEIKQEFTDHEKNKNKPENHTFSELVRYYRKHYVKKAVFRNGEKISGFKQNLVNITKKLDDLENAFGDQNLRLLSYEDIRLFTEKFQRTKTTRNTYPTRSTVNNMLAVFRRVLTIAVQKDWLDVNPFSKGDPLITNSKSNARHRVLSFEEEQRLLAACSGTKKITVKPKNRAAYDTELPLRRAHIIPLIIVALDTALRRSEIFKLKWSQIDLEKKVIYLTGGDAADTKTGAEGILPITDRLFEILTAKFGAGKNPKAKVFEQIEFKRAFASACADAKLGDLQFRDFRATAITRLLNAGVPAEMVRKISRHSKETDVFFNNYVRIDTENAQNIGEKLSGLIHSETVKNADKSKQAA